MDSLWDLGLFFLGFLSGGVATIVGMVLLRVLRDARRSGDELIARLGPLESSRFLEVVRD
jgi:hypothetical protein